MRNSIISLTPFGLLLLRSHCKQLLFSINNESVESDFEASWSPFLDM